MLGASPTATPAPRGRRALDNGLRRQVEVPDVLRSQRLHATYLWVPETRFGSLTWTSPESRPQPTTGWVTLEAPITPRSKTRPHNRVSPGHGRDQVLGTHNLESTTGEVLDMVVYRMQPEAWSTADYGKRIDPDSG